MSDDLFNFEDVPKVEIPDDPPPPKEPRQRKPRAAPKPAPHSSKVVNIQNGLEELYVAVGIGVSVFNQIDGETIVESAPRAAEAWDRAARKNPRLKETLERFLTMSTVAEVFAIHLSIVAQIASNHGLLPEKLSEVLSKDEPTNGSGNGFPMGVDPASIPREALEEIFPQMKQPAENI